MPNPADWYRRHLGPPARTSAPPQATVPRFVIGADGRAVPVYPDQPAPTEQYPAPPPWQQEVAPGQAPVGKIAAGDAVRLWKGSRAAHEAGAHAGRCPQCGSSNYLERITAALGDGVGGESGRASVGFCMNCGYRPGGRGTPSPQLAGSIRPAGQGEIPVEQARVAVTPKALRWNGKPGIIARIG